MTKKPAWSILRYCALLVIGNAMFALGFNLFLVPNSLNVGHRLERAHRGRAAAGLSSGGGGSMIRKLRIKIVLVIVLVAAVMLGVIFGGVLTGAGLGLVFLPGATTGGTDILARLLKRHFREVKMGYVTLAIDTCVLILTGLVFRDISKTLYSAVTLFICSRVLDAVLYGLDYSSVALIISDRYEDVYRAIDKQLDRGVTFLEGRGGYTGAPKTVLMTAVKSRQISELKQLVQCIDPNAFMIVQPAHQVLGEGFKRYNDDI